MALAVVGFSSYLFGLESTVYPLVWAGFFFSGIGAFFVEYKRPEAVIFLTPAFMALVMALFLSFPWFTLFSTLALEVGMLDSYIASRLESTKNAGVETAERTERLLTPFFVTGRAIRRVFRDQSSPLLFIAYSILPIFAGIVALVLWLFVGETPANAFIIATGFYFALATHKLIRKPLR